MNCRLLKYIALALAAALCFAACAGREQTPREEASSAPESSSSTLAEPEPESSSGESEPEPESKPEPEPEPEEASSLPEAEPAPEESSLSEAPAEPQPEESAPAEESSQPAAQQPAAQPNLPQNAEFLDDVEVAVFAGINDQRDYAGISSVQWDDRLAQAARIRAAELYRGGYTAHTRPDGSRWVTVLQSDVPVAYASAGEILASLQTQQNGYKISEADYWVNQWVNSSSHYDCMVGAKYTHAGTAVLYAYDEATGLSYGYACTIFAAY